VTASVILRKLAAYPRQNGLALSLKELGKLERTLFTLQWLQDPELRRRSHVGLNKGEQQNALRYITTNVAAIPNYADRHRHGEPIATGFVESAFNQVVSKRFVKKQQMRWTPNGAHSLLQVRTRVLNQQLRGAFDRWHPQLRTGADPVRMAA
jgi:hypothetical protein